MKKVLSAIFVILSFVYCSAHATTCVPHQYKSSPGDSKNYLQFYSDSYALCNGTKDGTFKNCPLNTIAEGWDGNLHKCTKDGWVTIDIFGIKECKGPLEQLEDSYSSNLGVLVSNKDAQQEWIIYFNSTTQDDNFIGLKNDYCKFSQNEYDKLLNNCLTTQKGDFLYWDTENKKTILCETEHNPQEQSIITVKDANSNPLSGVQIIYIDTNHDGTPILTGENGQATLEYNAKAQKQIVTFHKDGFSDVNKIISSVRKNPNIIMVAIQPDDAEHADTDIDATAQTTTDTYTDDITDENTDPEISDKLKSAQDALTKAKEAENSWANRGITAASSAMTGLGGMAAASAIAEQRADAEAEKEMRAYIETMKCEYGNGQNVKLGNEEITLPGGNELLDYYTEYKQLADNLKTTKSALGLRSGIESEVLYDRAQSGLYQYASIGKTGGAETSLYRALTDKESEDAVAWAEQKEKSAKQLKTGALVAAAGVATGVIGNYLINGRNEKQEKLKEEFTKKTKEVENKYSNDVLIRPQTNSLGANLGKFNTNLPTFSPLQTKNTEQPAVTQPEPIQNKLTNLNIKDKSLFPRGGYTVDSNNELLNSYANNIIEVLTKDEYKDITIEISIIGHTDKIPVRKIKDRPYQNNKELSNLRAEEVKKYLRNKLSTLGSRVTYSHEGKGYDECTKDGDQQECRRVEITAKDTTDYPE